MVKQVEDVIRDGVSVMVLDPSCNDKMIGVRLAYVETKDHIEPKSTFEKYCQDFPETHAAIMAMFDELMWPGDVFSKYPSVNNIYDMFALATLPDYRGRGLATKLVQQALIVAKKVSEKKKIH